MSDESREEYIVTLVAPGALSDEDVADCLAIITRGGAVNPESAREELPLASSVVVARRGKKIVGVGAVKRARPEYVASIRHRSGEPLNLNMPELGYVAIEPEHRGNHLSSRIVAELLSHEDRPLFATTDNARMKATLRNAGFVQRGKEWDGARSRLSLWIKE